MAKLRADIEKRLSILNDLLKQPERGESITALQSLLEEHCPDYRSEEERDFVRIYYEHLTNGIQKLYGPEHFLMAKAESVLANFYLGRQKVRAIQLQEHALTIFIKVYGPESSEVAGCLALLENWYWTSGRKQDAEVLKQRRWAKYPLCQDLAPLESFIIREGGKVTDRQLSLDGVGTEIFVDVCLNVEVLAGAVPPTGLHNHSRRI